jgi:alpha-tubulin suppressor-like RCC1 family protein
MRSVYTCGCGHDGRLGHGSDINMARLKRVAKIDQLIEEHGPVESVNVGGFHTFVRFANAGAVAGFGCNDDGQLGTADRTSRRKPEVIDFFTGKGPGGGAVAKAPLKALSCGTYHSAALLSDGSLYTTGKNDVGQLGHGDKDDRNRFTKMASIEEGVCSQVSCGSFNTLAMVSPVPGVEVAMACGRGDFGELGFDADGWDVMAEQERRVKAQVTARAQMETMQQRPGAAGTEEAAELQREQAQHAPPEDDSNISAVTGKPMMKPKPKFGKKQAPPPPKRREAFSRTTLSLVIPPRELVPGLPAGDFSSTDLLQHLIELASDRNGGGGDGGGGSGKALDLPAEVRGMHHHSAFRTAASKRWFTFGCCYNGGIETDATSIPRPLLLRLPGDAAVTIAGVHAADEVFFAWTAAAGAGGGQLFAKGKGAMLGLGDEDAWEEDFKLVTLPRPALAAEDGTAIRQTVVEVTGVNFVVVKSVWAPLAEAAPGGVEHTAWYAMGDNYFGQLAQGDEETRAAPVEVLPPAALGPGAKIVDLRPGYRHLVALVEEPPIPPTTAAANDNVV